MTEQEFDLFLGRVADFHQTVAENVAELDPHPEPRYGLAFQSALLSIEHGSAAYVLIASRFHAPAYSLLRTQFETLVRGIWLMYAASDSWVEKLNQPLTVESAESTKDALMLDKMLKALRASESAPSALLDQLEACRDVMWKALNSFTHGGFHPLARASTGYPPQLNYDVLRNSNALISLASQLTAIVSGDPENMSPVRALHQNFADCIPIV
jgi:hypothetical protein